jgi:hypothetical protein
MLFIVVSFLACLVNAAYRLFLPRSPHQCCSLPHPSSLPSSILFTAFFFLTLITDAVHHLITHPASMGE